MAVPAFPAASAATAPKQRGKELAAYFAGLFSSGETAFRLCFHCLSPLRPCLSLWCCSRASGKPSAPGAARPAGVTPPFLGLPMPFNCLSLAFRFLFTAFP